MLSTQLSLNTLYKTDSTNGGSKDWILSFGTPLTVMKKALEYRTTGSLPQITEKTFD